MVVVVFVVLCMVVMRPKFDPIVYVHAYVRSLDKAPMAEDGLAAGSKKKLTDRDDIFIERFC